MYMEEDDDNKSNSRDYTYYKQYFFKVNKLVFQSMEDMQQFIKLNNPQSSTNKTKTSQQDNTILKEKERSPMVLYKKNEENSGNSIINELLENKKKEMNKNKNDKKDKNDKKEVESSDSEEEEEEEGEEEEEEDTDDETYSSEEEVKKVKKSKKKGKKNKSKKQVSSLKGCSFKNLPKVLKVPRVELEVLYKTTVLNRRNDGEGCHNTFYGFGGIFRNRKGLQLFIKSSKGDIKIHEIIWVFNQHRGMALKYGGKKNILKHSCNNLLCQNPSHIFLYSK